MSSPKTRVPCRPDQHPVTARFSWLGVAALFAGAGCVQPSAEPELLEPVTAELQGENLGGANLGGANLGGSNLGGANLGGANLGGANLGGANLGGGNLGGANLGGNNLGGINIAGDQPGRREPGRRQPRAARTWAAPTSAARTWAARTWPAPTSAGATSARTNLGGANLAGRQHRLEHPQPGPGRRDALQRRGPVDRPRPASASSWASARRPSPKLLGQQSANARISVALGKLPWGFATASRRTDHPRRLGSGGLGRQDLLRLRAGRPTGDHLAGRGRVHQGVFRWNAPPSQTMDISGIEASAAHDPDVSTVIATYTGMMNAGAHWRAGQVADKDLWPASSRSSPPPPTTSRCRWTFPPG